MISPENVAQSMLLGMKQQFCLYFEGTNNEVEFQNQQRSGLAQSWIQSVGDGN